MIEAVGDLIVCPGEETPEPHGVPGELPGSVEVSAGPRLSLTMGPGSPVPLSCGFERLGDLPGSRIFCVSSTCAAGALRRRKPSLVAMCLAIAGDPVRFLLASAPLRVGTSAAHRTSAARRDGLGFRWQELPASVQCPRCGGTAQVREK